MSLPVLFTSVLQSSHLDTYFLDTFLRLCLCQALDMIRTNAFCGTEVLHMGTIKPSSPSSRILDIPCGACGDFSSGKHYGIYACDGCAGFFKRSIRRGRTYICKAKDEGTCVIDKTHRNQCRACRLARCKEAGMNKDAVQHERGPRNATIRRQQLAQYYMNDSMSPPTVALDLAMPKLSPPAIPHSLPLVPPMLFNSPLRLPITLPVPQPIVAHLTPTGILELAATIHMGNIEWSKSLPEFNSLLKVDQLLLLQNTWCDLFLLSFASYINNYTPHADIRTYLQPLGYTISSSTSNVSSHIEETSKYQLFLTNMLHARVDINEYQFLKGIALFNPETKQPSNEEQPKKEYAEASKIRALQEQTQDALQRYVHFHHPSQPLRMGKLLMLLADMKCISTDAVEACFFRYTLCDTPMVHVIGQIFKSNNNN